MYLGIPLSDFDDLSRQTQFKMEIYFDGLEASPVMVEGSDRIMSVSILEELSSDIQSFLGNASANEYVIQLDDTAQNFSPENTTGYGPKIKRDIPLKLYARAGETKKWIPMGTCYVLQWQSTKENNVVTITAYDILYKILNADMPLTKTKTNISIKTFLRDILLSLGLTSEDFNIDTSFDAIKLPYSFARTGKVGATIQPLLLAAMAYMYVDRSGIVQITPWVKTENIVQTLTDDVHVFSPNSQLGLHTQVQAPRVEYTALAHVPGVVIESDGHKVSPGLTLIENIKPSTQPVLDCEYIYVDNPDVDIQSVKIGSNRIDIEFNNTRASEAAVKFQVICNTLKPIEMQIHDIAPKETGNIISSAYIQESARAQQVQVIVDKNTKCHVPYMDVSNRGNCALELGDFIRINCPSVRTDYKGRLYRIKWQFDGSLSATYTLVNSEILGGI